MKYVNFLYNYIQLFIIIYETFFPRSLYILLSFVKLFFSVIEIIFAI